MKARIPVVRFLSAVVALGLAYMPLSVVAARLTPQLVLSLRAVSDVALAPDGREILFRRDRVRTPQEPLGAEVGELWRVSSAGGEPKRIDEAGFDARAPRWSPDGSRIAWLARTDSSARLQLYVAAADGSQRSVVTREEGGVQALEWSPDGKRIAYTAWDAPTEGELVDIKEGRDWVVVGAKPKQLRLYVTNPESRSAHLVTRAELTVHHFAWSPDGAQFVIGAAPSPTDDDRALYVRPFVVSAAGGQPRQIAEFVGRVTDPCWSNDGKWIAWLGSTELADPWAGNVFAVAASGGAPRLLTQGFEGTATTLQAVQGRASEFALRSEERQHTVLRAIDAADGKQRMLGAPSQILLGAPSFDKAGRTFAIAANAPDHPNEVFIGRPARPHELHRVTNSNPQLTGVQLGQQEVMRWKSRDGLDVEGVLIRPAAATPAERLPIVMHVHGGSEGIVLNGWQASYNNFGQLLAARGYAVLYPNYRGSRGRGSAYVMGNRRDIMGREWEDIESGLNHAIELGFADGARAGIYGFSWGGYAAGWGATYASHRFRAAVGGAGIYNWISEAGTNDTRMHEQLTHWDQPLYENFLGYLQRSPIYHIQRARTPVLLLHGERDESCPVGQAVEFHTALKWQGVPVELVIYPREAHGMDEAAHRLDFLRRGLDWFDRYLSLTPPRASSVSTSE
jgi:dipeptidyl aminopeptidase/acylaminoacyl peptidase